MRSFFIGIFLFPFIIQAQSINDVKLLRERKFTGAGLCGFMNGGADLFLGYGVQSLLTREVKYKNENFTIEVYNFPSEEDAFGIYSLHVFKCMRVDALTCFDCLSPFQLQAAIGKQYISVVFHSGSGVAQRAADELLRLYSKIDSGDSTIIPPEFEIYSPYSERVKYLRGALSLSNCQSSLSKVLEGIPFKDAWLYVEKSSQNDKALIRFSNKIDLEKTVKRLDSKEIISHGDSCLFISIKKRELDKNVIDTSFGF